MDSQGKSCYSILIFNRSIVVSEKEKIGEIVKLLKQAQELATEMGYTNLFQPGMAKELIIGDRLGHIVHKTKHQADAWNADDPSKKYEYLSCWDGGTFQLDRMFKYPANKKARSMSRITRNDSFFCVVFKRESPLEIREIFEIPVYSIVAETERQLAASSNDISHVGFTTNWARQNGRTIR